MPICFLKKASGKKPAAAAAPPAAEPSKPSLPEEAAGTMELAMPGAEYPSQNRRLKNIQMIRYNFDDDLDDGYYHGTDDRQMHYPGHAVVAPPYHSGMRHMSARSLPQPHPHCDCYAPPPQYSSHLLPPPPYGHYPPALPQRHFSRAPPPWQRFSPAPWSQFGPHQHFGQPRQHFGPPRPHFGPPRRPFAPSTGYGCYGDY